MASITGRRSSRQPYASPTAASALCALNRPAIGTDDLDGGVPPISTAMPRARGVRLDIEQLEVGAGRPRRSR